MAGAGGQPWVAKNESLTVEIATMECITINDLKLICLNDIEWITKSR